MHTADWWLGELDDPYFKALANASKRRMECGTITDPRRWCKLLFFSRFLELLIKILPVVDSFGAVVGKGVQVSCVTFTYGSELRKLI